MGTKRPKQTVGGDVLDALPVPTAEALTSTPLATKPPIDAPLKKRRMRYQAAIQRACSADDLKQIMEKAVEDAKLGDKDARQCVLNYLVGKPEPLGGETAPQTALVNLIFGNNAPRG